MKEQIQQATLTRGVRMTHDQAWLLVADTNRWDRAAGLRPAKYQWMDRDGRRQRVARTREFGFDVEWIEPPYEWITHEFVQGQREFLLGPVSRAGLEVQLEAISANETRIQARAYMVCRPTLVSAILGQIVRLRFRSALRRYFDQLDVDLKTEVANAMDQTPDPDAARTEIRRSLMNIYNPILSGNRSPINQTELDIRARKLAHDIGHERSARVAAFLRNSADEDVAQIRPFELARVWNEERREILRAFLFATRAGLVDLRWQINCPVCRVASKVVSSMSDIGREVHCDACNIEYGLNFAEHVEAVFQSNPAIREVQTAVYCASSPSFVPHIFAQLYMKASEERRRPAKIPRGTLLVRNLYGPQRIQVDVPSSESSLQIEILPNEVRVQTVASSSPEMHVCSRLDKDAAILVEKVGWSADAVLGSVMASFPEFLDLFATEAPAAGIELAIGSVAVLFSDLTGSTAMYQKLGDARAFVVVEQHFRSMDEAIQKHGGAVVKTMGDAVMANFSGPVHAVKAALEMVRAHNRQSFPDVHVGVKLGVHAGPCLLVRAKDRLDFFGTTVNLAARLQAEAKSNELVLTEDLASHSEICELLKQFPKRTFEASLRGIETKQKLVAFNIA